MTDSVLFSLLVVLDTVLAFELEVDPAFMNLEVYNFRGPL